MTWQPKRWTRDQLAERRQEGARLLWAGKLSQAEIARQLGVSRAAVTHWKQRLQAGGLRSLRSRPPPGGQSSLTVRQWQQLLRLLRHGAQRAGFPTERWTLRRIATVIERTFGVHYHFRSLSPALHARGWSPQQPLPRARERDEALIAAWLRHDWPRVKGGLAARGVRLPSWTRRVSRFGPG
jgi:putative transposase